MIRGNETLRRRGASRNAALLAWVLLAAWLWCMCGCAHRRPEERRRPARKTKAVEPLERTVPRPHPAIDPWRDELDGEGGCSG